MPNWGLTAAQRESEPWGLHTWWLEPSKTVTDPVHHDIYLNRLEAALVDSAPMQRLRRVRQLGTTQLVYPGATQSRFSHALGTLRAAQDLLDAVWNSQTNPQSRDIDDNLIAEWRAQGPDMLNAEFAKATVLARLGGLMHDLCHIPLGHTIEDDLNVLRPHDEDVRRFDLLWSQLDGAARGAIQDADGLYDELRVLIISKDEHAKTFNSAYPFVQDIVGNTICADLIDYIQRDHHSTGLPLALGHRFLDSFYVVPSSAPHYKKRMVINVDRDGRGREDIVTELVKYLRYRYELTERVLTHHAKTAADAMLGKMLELWHDDLWLARAAAVLQLGETDLTDVTTAKAAIDSNDSAVGTRGGDADSQSTADRISIAVAGEIQREFLRRSDDGMLEFLAETSDQATKRRRAVSSLASALLNRDLYKVLGHATGPSARAVADQVYRTFAENPQDRRQLEREAAAFAGIDRGWHCVAWIPKPGMRFKVADVLVHREGTVAPLSQVEDSSRSIVEQHHRLWAVTVYGSPQVKANPNQQDAVLAYIGEKTGLMFHRPDGTIVPKTAELVVDRLLAELARDAPTKQQLLQLNPEAKDAVSVEERLQALRVSAQLNDLLDTNSPS